MNNEHIFGVYYVFCDNNWKDVFTDQITTINKSNILEKFNKLHVVVGSKQNDDFEFVKNKFNSNNIKFYNIPNNLQFEFPALNLVKQICEKYVCKILYFHTKGTGISESNMRFYHGSDNLKHIQSCVKDWRKFMEFFNIIKNNECLKILDSYDACGVNLTDQPYKHYSGNFWWSKSSYINSLPDFNSIDITHRWNAEFWIGMGNGKLYNFYTEPNAGYIKKLTTKY